jgi:hypothetical protein
MKKITIFYWICTGLIVVALGIGSVLELISASSAAQITSLGYPAYLVPFLSIARLLAIAVFLFPVYKYPILREWAYAGITFDLLGAFYSQIAAGGPLTNLIGIIIPLLLLIASYLLYHKKTAATGLEHVPAV